MGTATFAALGALLVVLQTSLSTEAPCSPGFSSGTFLFRVRRRWLHPSMRLGKVEFSDCSDRRRFVFHSEDSRFSVQSDGALTVKRHVTLHDDHRDFSVHAWDSNGNKFTALVRVRHQEHHHGDRNHGNHHGDRNHGNHHGDRNHGNHHGDRNHGNHHGDRNHGNHHGDEHQEHVHRAGNHSDQSQRHHHGDGHHHGDQPQGHHHGNQDHGNHHGDQHQGHHQGNHEKHQTHGQTEAPPLAQVHVQALPLAQVHVQAPPLAQVHVQDASSRQKREAARNEEESVSKDRRRRREWTAPDVNFPENDRGPFPKKVVQIRSIDGKDGVVHYSITGPGADLAPEGLFVMDKLSGILYVTEPLDRESTDHYTFMVHAVAEGGGPAESPLELKVVVIDMNDNRPVFPADAYEADVPQSSPLGFEIVQVTATDADQDETHNALLRYKILDQEPKSPTDMFSIDPVTGFIRVTTQGLDREKNPKYTLEIEAADMEGNGLTGRTKVILTVTDGNESPTAALVPVEEVHSRLKRQTMEEEAVLYFPQTPKGLRRRKREWVIPDINFPENDRGPFPKRVSQIRSSDDKARVILYSITGPGADQPPEGLFTMDKLSGILYVTEPLDREAIANYTFMAHAVAEGSGQAEKPMEIKVIVIDMNDNRPLFTKDTYLGEVAESSPLNHNILQVTATDADQEGTNNALIQYKILDQEPKLPSPDMFTINPVNGFIRVNARGLDREKNPKYTLEIEAADMEGNGLTGRTKVILTVTDSNDNAPAYEQTQYTATVDENKKGAMVVKMLVTDKDDAHTPAWNAKFTIVDGDVNGLFSVETGPNKQEGIISTAKGLDFEKSRSHTLVVAVENEVPFAIKLPTATATVVVTVADVNEAPIFEPTVKQVSKREDLKVDFEVVQYTAYDPDTARNQKVMYRIVSDPAGWLNVAKDTGLVTVKSLMDRESLFVKNDVYTALIGAYDNDEVPATGTGTLEIKLEDVNDNAPSINDRDIRVCNKEPASHLLSVTDKDGPGFSAPFRVDLQGSSQTNWTARMNDSKTGIVLLLTSDLDPGFYDVQLQVFDTEGENQLSTVKAQVCSCKGPDVMCEGRAAGGPPLPIILGVLAGIMLLLMMVLLLLLFARRKRVDQKEPLLQEDDIRDNIYYYDEEGGGEDDQNFDLSVLHRGLDNRPEVFRNDVAPNFMPAPQYRPRPANPDEIGNFIDDNLKAADNDPTAPPYDSLLVFDYEGGGSDSGSLSSLNSSSCGDQDYDCLGEWGPRFKKLADMYGGGEDDDDMI
ncbi:B-cadherin-like [Eucyclogobius newberryi]|uniref:B-cadherin-like n=1 Tax=Eucyclogobius newberryi TaxID=166745 RepID=UPI003B5AD066